MTAAEREFGTALYELAAEEHCEDACLEGLETAVKMFTEMPEYIKLVQNPAVPKNDRLAMLDEAFGTGVHGYVLNFLKILCERSMLGTAEGCLQEYKARLYEQRGILPVQAISAVELDEAQKKALCAKLAEKTGKTILLETSVDPSVLGGIRLRYSGTELDGTTAGRLASLRRVLTQA